MKRIAVTPIVDLAPVLRDGELVALNVGPDDQLYAVIAEKALDYRQVATSGASFPKTRPESLQSYRVRVPEVIVLTSYDRLPSNAVTFSRRNIFKRDRFTCQYCGKQPGSEELTIDHVLPRAQGGTSTWENCVLACIECNAKKADRTPDRHRRLVRHAEPVNNASCRFGRSAFKSNRPRRRGCHCVASRCGRSGSRCTARTECGSPAGPSSPVSRAGQSSWKSESRCS